jgi:hypothetical protein
VDQGTQFLLALHILDQTTQVIACQDQATYEECLAKLPPRYSLVNISLEAARNVLQARNGVGVGVYVSNELDAMRNDYRRAEALHLYVTFMISNLGDVLIHQPVELKAVDSFLNSILIPAT